MSGPAATSSHSYQVGGREETLDAVLLVVPLVRAATGEPLASRAAQPHALTRHPYVRARIASGGFLVIAGRPDLALRAAPAPSTVITAELAIPGEPVISRDFTIPTGSALPVHEPAWELDDPVRTVTGTVRRIAFPFPAVAGASVAAGTGLASTPFALALRTPLGLDHATGLTVQACTLTAGPATTLAEPVAPGDLSVVLASAAGITAGMALAFGADPVREQVIADGPGPDPGQVLLRTPVVHRAPAGTAINAATAAVSGPASVLTRAALAGDGVLLLDVLPAGVSGGAAVQLVDGVWSEIRAPHALSDADGHFRLAGVRNFAELELTATGPAGTGSSITTPIDPGGGPVIADLTTP